MKNDLTTGAWQHDIGCPISITLLSTSDGCCRVIAAAVSGTMAAETAVAALADGAATLDTAAVPSAGALALDAPLLEGRAVAAAE